MYKFYFEMLIQNGRPQILGKFEPYPTGRNISTLRTKDFVLTILVFHTKNLYPNTQPKS